MATVLAAVASLTGSIAMQSCASDEGNYDYKTLNTLDISGVESKYEIEQFSTLELTPVIKGSQSYNADDYDYLWFLYMINERTGAMPDTLSHELHLKAEIAKSPESYCLVFQAKEKSTGIITRKRITLNVVNTYSKGLAILSDVEGMADVSFINSLDRVSDNAYQTVNGRPLGRGPIGIFHGGRNANCQQQLFISTEDSCVAVDNVDFSYQMNFNSLFYFPSRPGRVEGYGYGSTGFYEYVIVDGKVFKRMSYVFDDGDMLPMFNTTLTCADGGKVAPQCFYNDNGQGYFFDTVHHRFVYDDYEGLSPLSDGYANDYFNPLDLQMDLVWGDVLLSDDEQSYFRSVMQDADGQRYLLHGIKAYTTDFETYDSWYYITPRGKLPLTGDAARATGYAMSSKDVNYLYCACGNRIICVSILTGNIISELTLDGGDVDRIEFDQNDPGRMFVGVSDGSRRAKSGSVYYLTVGSNGQLSVEKKFENICGRVVDFQVNYGNAE